MALTRETINLYLDQSNPTPDFPRNFLQGSLNKILLVTLLNNSQEEVVGDAAKVTVGVIYNPRMEYGKLKTDGGFTLRPGDSDYDVTITQGKINIPLHEKMVAYAGKNQLVVQVEDTFISYTYQMNFMVDRNNFYSPTSIPDNLPTFEDLRARIEALENGKANKDLTNVTNLDFKNKASAAGIGNYETPAQIRDSLETLKSNDRLDASAIKNLPVTPTDYAKSDLSNVDDKTIIDKNKGLNFLQNDLATVDLQKLGEKYEDTDSYKAIHRTITDVDTELGNKVNTDMTNVNAAGLSDEIKKTNAYQDLLKRTAHPSFIQGVTLDQVKAMFERNFFEEQNSVDLSQSPFTALTLYMQYQMTINGQTLSQTLPPVSQNKVIMVSKINSTGIINTKLAITPNSGDNINGVTSAMTFGPEKSGYLGYFMPIVNVNGYEFVPHETTHEFSLAVSDDKSNVHVGINSIQFKKATVTDNDGMLIVTPDPSQGGGGITGIGIIDKTGASTTDVAVITLPQGTVTSGAAGTATINFDIPAGNELTFVDDDKREFKGTKIQSLDKKIRISNMGGGLVDLDANYDNTPDGIFAKLGNPQPINTNFHDQRLYYGDVYDKTGMYIGVDMNDKGFTIQEGDMLDPNITGGSTFNLGMYFEPTNGSVASDNGYVELKVIDLMTKDYLLDVDGNPIAVRREYKQFDVLGKELLLAVVRAKGQKKIAFEIDCSFGNQIVEASDNTCVYIQALDNDHNTGIAEMIFQSHTGYQIHKHHIYYGTNFMNLARDLVKDKGEAEINSTYELMGDGVFFDVRTKAKAKIDGYKITIRDNGVDLPVFSLGKIFNEVDTYELRLKNLATTVKIEDKQNAFYYALMKWTGQGEATLPILSSYSADTGPIFASGWVKVADKFISEDAVSGIHTDTNAFTVPADAKQVAMIIYPQQSQIPVIMTLQDFEVDVRPEITKTIISNTSHISEFYLENNKYVYRSLVSLPNGMQSYRYTINNTDTKLPVGKFKTGGGTGEIINDNSWSDAGSSDPEKTQGDIKFLVDGEVTIDYECRVFNETGTINNLEFWLAKNNNNGTFTEVPNSRYATTIEANRNVAKVINSKQFTFDVKTNETYRFFGKTNIPDGAYIQSSTRMYPLIQFNYDFDEITEKEQQILDDLDYIKKHSDEVVFVKGNTPVSDPENYALQIDVDTGKTSIVKKK